MKVVVAHYNENISWLNNIGCNYIVYSKGSVDLIYSNTTLTNVGREADTYLHHIIENYDCLDNTLIFLQGNPFDHCHDVLHKVNNITDQEIKWLCSNWGPVTKDYQGGPGSIPLPLLELCDKLFDLKFDQTKTFTFSPGAQYVVPKKFILNKSLDWWKYCYSIFNNYIDTSPWAYERLWPIIWDYSTYQ
jgi:hypothetical protein